VIDLTDSPPAAARATYGAPSLYYAIDPASGDFSRRIGKGLFVNRSFRKNESIDVFCGEVISLQEADTRIAAGRGGYMIALRSAAVLDCFATAAGGTCLASLANTANGLRHAVSRRAPRNNSRIRVSGGASSGWRVTLVATGTITTGSEVLTPYSGSYVMPRLETPGRNPASQVESAAPSATACRLVPTVVDLTVSPPPARPAGATVWEKVLRHNARQRETRLPIFTLQHQDEELLRTTTTTASACLTTLFGDPQPVTVGEVEAFLREAHQAAADTFGVLAAVEWGGDFEFPADLLERDRRDFEECGRSLQLLAATRRARSLPDSFSLQRVHACFGGHGLSVPGLCPTDFQRLCRLATVGVEVPVPRRFTPRNIPAPLRTKYLQVHNAVNRSVATQAQGGGVLLLPTELAEAHPGVYLGNAQHWTTKKGKPQGRCIADMSNVEDPDAQCPLNGHTPAEKAEVNSACEALYGSIQHPTLTELMLMVLSVAEEHGWENISLWKMDLQGAFNLLWFDPEATPLLAFPLAAGVVAIHLVGLFGWAGMPAAFHVLTRALELLVQHAIRGKERFYVDDCMGCSPKIHLHADLTAAHNQIVALAGTHAVATDKTEHGRSLEFIGWQVCLDTRSVSVSPRNLLKTAQAFFCFAPRARLSRMHVERMASLASRISVLCRFMRPFTRALSREATLFGANPATKRALSTAAHCEIAIWRAFCVLLHLRGDALRRSIESFRPSEPAISIRYDASLTQLAVGVYESEHGSESLLRFAALHIPFPTSEDSSRQNTYEYLAVVLGLLLLVGLGRKNFSFLLFGDSVSSLAWVTSDRVASSVAKRANIAMVVLSVHCNAYVAETVHVPGVDNIVYDGLSRGKSAAEVGLDPSAQLLLQADHPYARFIGLCDPALRLETPEECLALAGALRGLLPSN
jgi:hypothetical protein